jgi:hypothetical protein
VAHGSGLATPKPAMGVAGHPSFLFHFFLKFFFFFFDFCLFLKFFIFCFLIFLYYDTCILSRVDMCPTINFLTKTLTEQTIPFVIRMKL